MIERAYREGEKMGLEVWTQDEAGPFQTIPYPGQSWQPCGQPVAQPHEYERNGTAKLLTLFRPATGEVRVKGVTSAPNLILHEWLKGELSQVVAALPALSEGASEPQRPEWESWQVGLTGRVTLVSQLPKLRVLLILDNLAGHKTPDLVVWLFQHGILPLYTPLSGSWLNMAESIQRILKRRALDGQHPATTEAIISWLEAAGRGWNADPTPFEWGGKRAARRLRARYRRHSLGGSGAVTRRSVRHRPTLTQQWRSDCQVTH